MPAQQYAGIPEACRKENPFPVATLEFDLGAPGWLVAIIAVVGVVVGHQLVNRTKAQELQPAT